MEIARRGRNRTLEIVLAGACAVALLAGCGQDESEVSTAPPPPRDTHQAATGPAIVAELAIDQLALDSPIRRIKDKNGLEFLHFKYTDNDGKVYKCVLPAPMAEGKHKGSEWLTTFNVYRQPEVIAQKKVGPGTKEQLRDFPFISPRPAVVKKPSETESRPRSLIKMPKLPTLPELPSTTSGSRTTPGASPMPGPRPEVGPRDPSGGGRPRPVPE